MRNLLNLKLNYQKILMVLIIIYLLFASLTFLTELYFRFKGIEAGETLSDLYTFVSTWHWTFLVVFLAYTVLTFMVSNYIFLRSLKQFEELKDKNHKYYIKEIKEHLAPNNNGKK